MVELKEIMNLLKVNEEDTIKAILNLVSPPPPPATRENWMRLSTFGNDAPSTKDLWKKLEDADFRCHKCGSQMRLSFNHINSNPKDHRLDNLEVICYSCNRQLSNKPTVDKNQHLKLALTAIQMWKDTGVFPVFSKIAERAGVKQVGGATYLLKFIKNRLENKK